VILEIIFSIIIGGGFALLTLPSILHLQISEYLLYRYRDFVTSKGIFKALVLPRFALPAKSPRNLLIFGFNILFLSLYAYLSIFSFEAYWSLLLFPVLVRLASILGALLTSPLAWLFRYRYIYLAQRQLNASKVKIIGITGSYGKSSVKEYLHQILSTQFITGKTRGNRNTEVGIAMEIALQVKPYTQYFVAEMGAYRKGDIGKLCRRFKPAIGVVTAVGNQHLSLFGSRENIAKTKLEMLTHSSEMGLASLDWDGAKGLIERLDTKVPIHKYSLEDLSATYIPKQVSVTNGKTDFSLKIDSMDENYTTFLMGRHTLLNLIPAIVIARKLGVDYENARDCVASLQPILGKLSLHSLPKYTVLNDSYNSNVEGFLSAIELLDTFEGSKKLVSSLGIFELGDEREESYQKVIAKLTELGIPLVTTDPLFKTLGGEIVHHVQNEEELLSYIEDNFKGASILIEGRHSPAFTKSLGILKAY